MLKQLGHTLSTAENGQIAVNMVLDSLVGESWDTHRFDVILMDLQMPVMDGLEAISRIRALESSSELTMYHSIIGCSADSDAETQEAALSAGGDIFMPKPFNATAFCTSVTRAQAQSDEVLP